MGDRKPRAFQSDRLSLGSRGSRWATTPGQPHPLCCNPTKRSNGVTFGGGYVAKLYKYMQTLAKFDSYYGKRETGLSNFL